MKKKSHTKVVQIAIARIRQFESSEANVIQRFVVNAESFVGVLYKLMY